MVSPDPPPALSRIQSSQTDPELFTPCTQIHHQDKVFTEERFELFPFCGLFLSRAQCLGDRLRIHHKSIQDEVLTEKAATPELFTPRVHIIWHPAFPGYTLDLMPDQDYMVTEEAVTQILNFFI